MGGDDAISTSGLTFDPLPVAGGALLLFTCILCGLFACCVHRRRKRKRLDLTQSTGAAPRPAAAADAAAALAQSNVQVPATSAAARRAAPPIAPPPTIVKVEPQSNWAQHAAPHSAGSGVGHGLPAGWEQHEDEHGTPFFYNVETGETAWMPPETRV